MIDYDTKTGYYVLVDSDERIGAKANVPTGTHRVPDWVDVDKSFDVDSADDLSDYDIHEDYRVDRD